MKQAHKWERELLEQRLVIGQILEMRFGDGTGQNMQVGLAAKEILAYFASQRTAIIKEVEEMIGEMRVPKKNWRVYSNALSDVLAGIRGKGGI